MTKMIDPFSIFFHLACVSAGGPYESLMRTLVAKEYFYLLWLIWNTAVGLLIWSLVLIYLFLMLRNKLSFRKSVIELCTDEDKKKMVRNRVSDCKLNTISMIFEILRYCRFHSVRAVSSRAKFNDGDYMRLGPFLWQAVVEFNQ